MELKTYFAQDAAGNIISSAIVHVFLQGTTTLATGLTRADGTPLENPFAADGAGRIQFRAPDGYYDVQVSAGPGIIQTLTIQCVDYSGAKADADRAEAAADRAKLAAEIAALDVGLYNNVSDGIAATVSGKYFSAVSGISENYIDLYLNDRGTPVLIKSYPSAEAVLSNRLVDSETNTAYEFNLSLSDGELYFNYEEI